MQSGSCTFCHRSGPVRAGKEDGLSNEVYVCESCWRLLKNPVTGLPLIRGNLMISMRGKFPEDQLKKMVNLFMEKISKWRHEVKN